MLKVWFGEEKEKYPEKGLSVSFNVMSNLPEKMFIRMTCIRR